MLTTTERAPRPALARRRGERAEQRLGQAERPEQVGRQRRLEVLALGVGEQRQRHRAEARRVVDQHVEAAERAADLQRDRVRVVLARDVADDAVRCRRCARATRVDARRVAGDEGDRAPRAVQRLDERQAEARGAAGDGDAQGREAVSGVFMCGVSAMHGAMSAKVGAPARHGQRVVQRIGTKVTMASRWTIRTRRGRERSARPARRQRAAGRRPLGRGHLARNLASLRHARALTQDALAKAAAVPRSTIANLESGAGNPSLAVLVKVAQRARRADRRAARLAARAWCGAGRRPRSPRAARAAA